ncbi:MAG: hypothetical protein ACE14L_01830 [Terriglobales bacterium]
MPRDTRDIMEILKFELDFLEQGGYGRSVRTPWKPTSMLQDSPSCLNFNDPDRPHPCSDCLLVDFVPAEARTQEVPCHHIPLGPGGQTICSLEGDQVRLEEAVRSWLRATIESLERERTVSPA